MSVDTLVLIDPSEWRALRDLYLCDWPRNMVGYYTLDTFVRWIEQRPQLENLHIYSLNGDWSDGTFVCIHRHVWLFINTLNASVGRLQTALGLLDWSGGFNVASFMDRHRSAVLSVVQSKDLSVSVDDRLMVYFMPRAEAKQLEIGCPDTITLKSLSADDAQHIDAVWRNRFDGSVSLLTQLIELSPNVGAYNEHGDLVGWCLRFETGPMGALQVDGSIRRMGLGSVVCRAMTRQLADMDMDVFACVLPGNTASRNMFEKTGFQHTESVHWVHTRAKY